MFLVGWGKNMIFIKKKRKIRGERWTKEGREEIFTVIGGKNMIIEKKVILIIYTPAFIL